MTEIGGGGSGLLTASGDDEIRRGCQPYPQPSDQKPEPQFRTSKIILNGVSLARRKW